MKSVHFTPEQLTERFTFSTNFRNIAIGLVGLGIVFLLVGWFLAEDHPNHGAAGDHATTEQVSDFHLTADTPEGGHGAAHHEPGKGTRMLANFLLGSVYFMTITMGCLFFLAVHQVGNAGWQTAIRRVPEAITSYLPIGVVGFAALFFFLSHLYEWSILEPGVDELIDEKRAYLNEPFFIIRNLVFFGIWITAAFLYRRWSVREDTEGGLQFFKNSTTLSAVFIVLFAISYSLFAVDWIKSLEPHWFSTIFGVYTFAGSMASAMFTMGLLVYFLKKQGYMSYVNDAHMHDIFKYAFGFSVFWAYIWVSQYLLIWYSNIPEEGIYYVKRYRVEDAEYMGYKFFFIANIILNFFIPFFALMTRNAKRMSKIFVPVAIIALIGHWVDLFQLIMPGAMLGNWNVGLIELGFFMTFAGIFLYVVFNALTKANLVPLQHPYLEESLHHSTGPV